MRGRGRKRGGDSGGWRAYLSVGAGFPVLDNLGIDVRAQRDGSVVGGGHQDAAGAHEGVEHQVALLHLLRARYFPEEGRDELDAQPGCMHDFHRGSSKSTGHEHPSSYVQRQRRNWVHMSLASYLWSSTSKVMFLNGHVGTIPSKWWEVILPQTLEQSPHRTLSWKPEQNLS